VNFPSVNFRHGADFLGGRVEVDTGENPMDKGAEARSAWALPIGARYASSWILSFSAELRDAEVTVWTEMEDRDARAITSSRGRISSTALS
jgi:hypothetical protein